MENLDLLILDVCNSFLQNGDYTIDGDVLIEKMNRMCIDESDKIIHRLEYLWENNFLESSNGRYYLTDKSLDLIKRIKQSNQFKH